MFLSLNDFSKYLGYGSYQFMSHVRVGYLIKDMKLNLMKFPEELVSMRIPVAAPAAPAPAAAPAAQAAPAAPAAPAAAPAAQAAPAAPAAQAAPAAPAAAAPISYATALKNTTKLLLSGGTRESFTDFEYVDQEDLDIDPSKILELYNEGLDMLSRVDNDSQQTINTPISSAAIFEGGNKRKLRKTRKHQHKYTHKKGKKRMVKRKTRKH